MLRGYFFAIAAGLCFANSIQAQTTIVDRPVVFQVADQNGELAGESNRFGNFSGFYPADHFVLSESTILDRFAAFGSIINPSSFSNSAVEGWTVQIFADAEGSPDGFAFADVFSGGNFGSEGIVYLPAVEIGQGAQYLQNSGGATTVEINFTVANGGTPITLPAGGYWITIAPRTPDWHPGDPSGRWKWQASIMPSNFERLVMSRTTFGDVEVWEPINLALGNSFAWNLTGSPATLLGDINLDGSVDLLDVAPFVELLATGNFQEEADANQDDQVNLLDVGPFVELLAN